MGILQNPLGINLTDSQPILQSPFTNDDANSDYSPPGPQGFFLELVGSPFALLDGENMLLL